MVGFWATLSLNIPDFSRYAYSQRDQMLGQALGLPTTMGLFSFIGVAVTSATVTIYGETIWDPVASCREFRDPWCSRWRWLPSAWRRWRRTSRPTWSSPANDFAHLWPRRISFRIGGFITGIIGILIQPWRLVADPSGYIFSWLIAYSSLLGAVGGILIADYFVRSRTRLDLKACVGARALLLVPEETDPCAAGGTGGGDSRRASLDSGDSGGSEGGLGVDLDVSLCVVHEPWRLDGRVSCGHERILS